MRKHKMKVRKEVYKRPEQAVSLAQVKSLLEATLNKEDEAPKQISHASIKAPKDKNKLMLVQINNQKPQSVKETKNLKNSLDLL
jgi:hypothetical protein